MQGQVVAHASAAGGGAAGGAAAAAAAAAAKNLKKNKKRVKCLLVLSLAPLLRRFRQTMRRCVRQCCSVQLHLSAAGLRGIVRSMKLLQGEAGRLDQQTDQIYKQKLE